MNHALKKRASDVSFEISANVEVPIDRHSVRSEAKSQNQIVILRSVIRIHRKELSFCAKRSEVAESTGEPSNCHSARCEAKSQNLIVILR